MTVPLPGRTGSGGVLCNGAQGWAWEIVPGGSAVTWWLTCDGRRLARWITVAVALPPEAPAQPTIAGTATHYGESYHGQTMGCGGAYDTNNTAIVAVSPDRYADWPCGTEMRVTGPAGSIVVVRTDSCPGCSGNHIDLSEAGFVAVCGPLASGTCRVELAVIE